MKADNAKHNLLNQEDDEEHLNDSIVFDPSGTLDCFKNPDLVQDAQQTKKVIKLKTNAGSKLNNSATFLPDCGEVWFDKDVLANIMALKNVKKMFKVDCNGEAEDAFILTHQKTGKVVKFKCQKNGLCTLHPQQHTETGTRIKPKIKQLKKKLAILQRRSNMTWKGSLPDKLKEQKWLKNCTMM